MSRTAVVTALLTLGGCDCGEGPPDRAATAAGGGGDGAGASAETTIGPAAVSASTATSSGTCYGGAPEEPARPEVIPEGWAPWGCWGPPARDCTLWSPPDPQELDPPLWIPCADDLPGGLECEQMAIAWAETEDDGISNPFLSIVDGTVMLGFARQRYDAGGSETSWVEYVTAEADGPVIAAGRKVFPRNSLCAATLTGSHGRRAVLNLSNAANQDDGAVLLDPSGWFLGFRHPEVGLSSWHLSSEQAIEQTYSSLIRHDIDFANPEVAFEGSITGNLVTVGDDLLFTAGSYYDVAVFGWRKGLGLVALEQFQGDLTRGAMGIGGDGEHLVWTRGEGRADVEPVPPIYDQHSIIVSPYTFDPAQLEPRRLRSDSNGGIGEPWRVGCGHAARRALVGPRHTQIVRLEDGAGWILEPVPDRWTWERPIGVSCEHVYVLAYAAGEVGAHTIARVRIDSLGEGSPPD